MTIKLPLRKMRLSRNPYPMDDNSENSTASTSSTFLKLRRRNNKCKPSSTAHKKSVSFDLDRSCTHILSSSEEISYLWYTRQEMQQFRNEANHQSRLHKEGQLPETVEQTSLGLELDRSLTRCKREYCYDAVLGEQIRTTKAGSCSARERAERIAKAYTKVQASFRRTK